MYNGEDMVAILSCVYNIYVIILSCAENLLMINLLSLSRINEVSLQEKMESVALTPFHKWKQISLLTCSYYSNNTNCEIITVSGNLAEIK